MAIDPKKDKGNTSAQYKAADDKIKAAWAASHPVAEPVQPVTTTFPPFDAPKHKLPATTVAGQVLPPAENWDYKSATTNPAGESLYAYKLGKWTLEPKGFDPNGQVYFGGGVSGWAKKFAYKIVTDMEGARWNDDEAKNRIKDSWDKLSNAFNAPISEIAVDAAKNVVIPLGMADESNRKRIGDVTSGVWGILSGLWNLGEAQEKKGGVGTILSATLKSTRLVTEAGLDALQGVADTAEKFIGMGKTMREYADTNGSKLPDLAMDFDPKKINETYAVQDELVNTLSRLLVAPLQGYDLVRFLGSGGTARNKLDALSAGWTENKMLYSELVTTTIQEDYRARVKNGEDPNLLIMELQDPWAEIVGEVVFDPLNALGMVGKAKHASDVAGLVRAETMSEHAVALVDKMNDAQNASTAALGSRVMDDAVAEAQKIFSEGKIGVQEYTPLAITATGNQHLKTRSMSNWSAAGIAVIKGSDGKLDDFLDWVGATLKISSKDPDDVRAGLAALSHSNIPTNISLSQPGLEASQFMRNLLGDGDVEAFIKKLRGDGDFAKSVETMDSVINDATKFAFPTISDMAKEAKKVELATDASKLSERTLKLSERYNALKIKRPGLVQLAEFDRQLMRFVHPINSAFAGVYFSLNYGFAARNHITNVFHVIADAGLGGYFENGRFLSMKKIDALLMDVGGGKLPISTRTGYGMADKVTETGGVVKEVFTKIDNMAMSPKALARKSEEAAGKRVFYKAFRDQMDMMLNPGVGTPKMEEWAAQGFSKAMVDDYIDLIKAKGYKVRDANKVWRAKHSAGVELWRQLDTVNPEIKKALSDRNLDAWDEITNFANQTDKDGNLIARTPEEIKDFFKEMKEEITARSNTGDDVIGVPHDSPAAEYVAETKARFPDIGDDDMTKITNSENSLISVKTAYSDALEKAKGKLRSVREQLIASGQPVVEIDRQIEKINLWKQEINHPEFYKTYTDANIANSSRWYTEMQDKLKLPIPKGDQIWSGNASDYKQMWRKNTDFMGPIPAEIDKSKYASWRDMFFRTGRDAWLKRADEIFDAHFAQITVPAQGFADDMGESVASIFEDAKVAAVRLHASRNNKYINGAMYYSPGGDVIQSVQNTKDFTNKLEATFGISNKEAKGAAAIADARAKAWAAVNGKNPDEWYKTRIAGLQKGGGAKLFQSDDAKLQELTKKLWDPATPKEEIAKIRREILQLDNLNRPSKAAEGVDVAKMRDELLYQKYQFDDDFNKDFSPSEIESLIKDKMIEPVAGGKYVPTQRLINYDLARKIGAISPEEMTDIILDNLDFFPEYVGASKEKLFSWVKGDYFAMVSNQAATNKLLQRGVDGVAKGGVSFLEDNTAIIHAFKNPDVSTVVHELGHIFRRDIDPQNLKVVEKWAGVTDGKWAVEHEEKFARAFEKYLADGRAPVKGLEKVFSDLKTWLGKIYKGITGSEIDVEVSPELRKVLDDLLGGDAAGLERAAPDYIDGAMPSLARAHKESQKGVLQALTHVEDEMMKRFGVRSQEVLSQSQIDQAMKFTDTIEKNVATANYTASLYAEKMRDFALLPYGLTTQLDHAAAYIMPYQFWYSRTYKNWMRRLSTNPALLANYARLKDTMASLYKDQPEWWKYNVKFPDFFGVNGGNPLFMNIEQTIWPLNGITGTDFNDPEKRTNWFTSTVDDMGKFGPNVWTPINMAIAGAYYLKGEKDIAAKWGSRLIPQTATIKAISSYFGSPIELDPNVNIFNGDGHNLLKASDPYEESRIGRALAAMESEGVYTKEQLMDAARTHQGPLWEEAYQRAVNQRAFGQITSALFGVGFKTRNAADMETDKFYADYGRMRNLHDGGFMSDEQYKQGFNELRERYPFMDIVLLSRRAGIGRDSAYAYNVISRVPPGMTSEIYKAAGLDEETVQKFYDSGGKYEGMSETEIQIFNAKMVEVGATLAIPDDTTRQTWTAVKNRYALLNAEMKQEFGDDILERISQYYGFSDTKQARLYLDTNPDVTEALDLRTEIIIGDPILVKYYGGVDTIERYYTSQMYDILEKRYPNIQPLLDGYSGLAELVGYDSKLLNKAQKAYKAENPELQQYWDDREAGYESVMREVVKFGEQLPAELEIRKDFPENPSPAQERIQELANPEPKITFEQWSGILQENMTEIVLDYANNGTEIPYPAQKRLDNLADEYGYDNGDDLLREILMSIP